MNTHDVQEETMVKLLLTTEVNTQGTNAEKT